MMFSCKCYTNTIQFAVFVGPIDIYLILLAWLLAQIPHRSRTVLALVIYSPSMTAGLP